MNENMEIVKKTENILYWGTILFGILNFLGLLGGAGLENTLLVSITTLVLVIMSVAGLSSSQSNVPVDKRHGYIFNTSYMAISLGISNVLILVSPRSFEIGLLVPSLIAACGWVVVGIYCIAREKTLSGVADWV